MNTENTQTTQLIPLKNLFLSPHNVRTASASKEADKMLKASIAATGLVQNLVVHQQGDKYGVVAGGRRYKMLTELKAEKVITGDYAVPCTIKDDSEITQISLAENIARADMHPADEFLAYSRLIEQGKTVVQVAAEFGVSQVHVKRRMKLASLSPSIIDHFKKGDLTLDQVIAFTVGEDHEKQEAAYKELSPHRLSPYYIRQMLLGSKVRTDSELVRLVTLKAYKAAGGTVTADMFENESFINDVELLEKMATDILNTKAVELAADGWKWVDVALDRHGYSDYQTTLEAKYKDVPKELTDKLKALENEQDELNLIDADDWTDKHEEREMEIDEEIEKLENERNAYRAFTAKQKALSGVVVTTEHGSVVVVKGLVKKADMAAAFPPKKSKASAGVGGDDDSGVPVEEPAVESQALLTDLETFRLQALQSELMKDDKLCYDMMLFSLARAFFKEFWSERPINVRSELTNTGTPDGIEETVCNESIRSFESGLSLSWLEHDEDEECFKAFREIASPQKKQLLSYITAMSFQNSEINPVIEADIQFDISQHWKPTKENYFSRVTRPVLLDIGSKQISTQWAVDNAKKGKGELIDTLTSNDAMADWLPASIIN